jgi:hypothetical protein
MYWRELGKQKFLTSQNRKNKYTTKRKFSPFFLPHKKQTLLHVSVNLAKVCPKFLFTQQKNLN